jgi:lysophospholipase L1-like esterase
MKKTFVLLCAVIILSLSGCATGRGKAESDVIKIMPLGDSITQGYEGNPHEFYSYRYDLWNKLQDNGYTNVNFVGSHQLLAFNKVDSRDFDKDHEGHGGWTTGQILTGDGPDAGGTGNLTTWLDGLKSNGQIPDIVLMHLGTNDSGNPDQTGVVASMKKIIDLLRSYNPNVTILLAKITPYPTQEANINALNTLISQQMPGYQTPTSKLIMVNLNTGFLPSWLIDGLHPDPTGAAWMANRWYDAMVPLLPSP